ncbi:hypothetical protein KBX08_32955 [Micromonospora sp. H61]|uniref:hypothetical protein n=1 Tax=Micromonospora sp. H61 TaxID=2824888 RepID=UPI001B36A09F|nr:hypothetical protein [Micromonospora sp. H61]MBQ0994864.1 hypothetical protein [Micromonospora sp. H61]
MAKPPRQPEQVNMDLTAEPGEGVPGERADPVIRRNTVNIKFWVNRVLGLELGLEESETNARSASVVHFAVITGLTMIMLFIVWAMSHSTVLSLVAGAITMVAGILFVRTTHAHKRGAESDRPGA